MGQDTKSKFQALLSALNDSRVDAIDEHLSERFFEHTPADDEPKQNDVFRQILGGLMTAMPDLTFEAGALQGDETVRGPVTVSGTHTNPLWGVPALNRRAEWTVKVAVADKDGRIAIAFEDLPVPEMLGALRQLELVNPPDKMDQPPRHPVEIPEILLQVVFNGQAAEKPCTHFDMIKVVEPTADVCKDCVAAGDIWPALRMCLTCGYVGCCDTSKNKHMKQHAQATGHPIFRSVRMNEAWCYCYDDAAFIPSRKLREFRAEAVDGSS